MKRELRLARAKAAYDHWDSFRSNPSALHPYLHPPDLFSFDPCVKEPYVVPSSFIPTLVGGNIEIKNRSKQSVKNEGTETTEFILANFLPGGYKKRWNFSHFRTFWKESEWKERHTNIEPSFSISRSKPLEEFTDEETFSPLKIPVRESTIYFPDAVNVEEVPSYTRYFWNDERMYMDHEGEGQFKVARDPPSLALWENILLTKGEPEEKEILSNSSLMLSIGYYPEFRISRCYYANALQLLGPNLTRVIRFVHDNDKRYALLGTEHLSQAVRFDINLKSFISSISDILEKDIVLYSDLRWKFFFLKLNEAILFQGECADSTYDLNWIQTFCIALDYWIKHDRPQSDIREFFTSDSSMQLKILNELIPESKEIRLRLAGFDLRKRNEVEEWITIHGKKIEKILDEVYNPSLFRDYVETVICETFQRSLKNWCQQFFSVVGDGLIFWQSGCIQNGILSIFAYDRYQGGSGISRELYKNLLCRFDTISGELNKELKKSLQCDVDIADSVISTLFSRYDSDYIYSIFQENNNASDEIIHNLINNQEELLGAELGVRRKDDLNTLVRLEIRRFIHSKDTAAMYGELIREYYHLKEVLKRTPTVIDILLASSANQFYDPRASATFEHYRVAKKGDLSEVHARVAEMIPACVDSCPECLEINEQYGERLNSTLFIDRRLLIHLLEMN